MAKYEFDSFLETQIGEPVPTVHAFTADDQVLSKRGDRLQECLGASRYIAMKERVSLRIHDAEIHLSRVEIDPTVELVVLGVELHSGFLHEEFYISPAYRVGRPEGA